MSLNSFMFSSVRRSFFASLSGRRGYGLSRFFGTATDSIKVDKTLLSKLRKNTGYGFSKCREALIAGENDYNEAEKWLQEQAQKEGWAKASKLKDRNAAEGLVGIVVEQNLASMVEVNCETDFVARNENFQNLVSCITHTAMQYRRKIVERNIAHSLSGSEVAHLREIIPTHVLSELKIASGNQETIADVIAQEIGKVGEKIQLKRAITITTERTNTLGSFVHGSMTHSLNSCMMGKYGACVALKPIKDIPADKMKELAWRLSQHVIGMNPQVISNEHAQDGITKESILLEQAYLHDTNISVGDFVKQEGVEIVDFVRYLCGE